MPQDKKSENIKERPIRPRLATERPITDPPKKAIFNAFEIPDSLAACAVRAFAFVAAFRPKNPAIIEHAEPKTKENAVDRDTHQVRRPKITTIKSPRILYSLLKKTMEPECISWQISSIFWVDILIFLILLLQKTM